VEARIGVVHGDVNRDSRGEHDGDVGHGEGGHGGDAEGGGGMACRIGAKAPSPRHTFPTKAVPPRTATWLPS
jgi:hypothetical protein